MRGEYRDSGLDEAESRRTTLGRRAMVSVEGTMLPWFPMGASCSPGFPWGATNAPLDAHQVRWRSEVASRGKVVGTVTEPEVTSSQVGEVRVWSWPAALSWAYWSGVGL